MLAIHSEAVSFAFLTHHGYAQLSHYYRIYDVILNGCFHRAGLIFACFLLVLG